MLTEDEICAVIIACASAPGGATEEDMKAAVQWAQQVRIDATLLDLVLEGRVAIAMRNGEPVFTSQGDDAD